MISTKQLKREFELVNEKISIEWDQDCEIADRLIKRRRIENPNTKQEYLIKLQCIGVLYMNLYLCLLISTKFSPKKQRKKTELHIKCRNRRIF